MTNIHQTARSFPDSTPISHKFFSSKTILWQPNLKELSLEGLYERLEVVFDLEGQKDNNDHQRIAVLAELKTLRVIGLSNLRYVWKNVPQGIQGFQNLTSINVYRCHKLRYLFPPTIAKLLVELQSIKIWWCDMIENIVQRDGEEEAEDIILLPKLTSFDLSSLPNLMSFCIKPYSFEWSSIEKIYMYGCPKFKTYGKLQKEGILTKDPRANDIDNNSKTWAFFPSHLIVCLKNLKMMKLSNCDSLEFIFQHEELKVEESHMALVLDQLRRLDLSDLPKLMHIWKKGPERILGFGNLRLLKVSGCDNLTCLFSPSVAKLLVMLEKIEVIYCKKIEEILTRAGEEEKEKDVLFDKVNSIVLCNLPNLKCFCSETNALDWPSLKEIRVIKCPSLSTFIPSNLNTPKLEGVYNNHPWIEERTCHWKGDLNATIEHIFKGKEKPVDH
ncbi:uncharacterized protein LOC126690889 [Quercus robur]|uniref:uncharacterized protein LOC126690889 n=1 Tax=Quercus robur TaxID=38942 RepID=UPI002161EEA0|nr:uncharacterized protein LOC126690889 [Quercus robur]